MTRRFARVFGDNGDQVYRCPDCAVDAEQYAGSASGTASAGGQWQ